MALQAGVVVQPIPGESESGDAYCIFERDRHAVVAVIDGLGHGKDAAYAALLACKAIEAHQDQLPLTIIEQTHLALRGSRGAVMAVLRIDRDRNEVIHAGVGNIEVRIVNEDRVRRPAPINGIVGHGVRKLRTETFPFMPGDLLIMTSDGISDHYDIGPGARGDDVQGIANRIVLSHGRHQDDQTVLVVRDAAAEATA